MNPTKAYEIEEPGLVNLGVDIGTTNSSVVNYNATLKDLHPLELFGAHNEIIPSVALYSRKGEPLAIGEEALEKYHQECKDCNNGDLRLLSEFKVKWGQREWFDDDFYITYDQVYQFFLSRIRDELRGEKFNLDAGKICIAHPAKKTSEDKVGSEITEMVSRVFPKSDHYKITPLDEASAVVQYLDQDEGFISSKPKNILVIDSGGGTTDFAFAETLPGSHHREILNLIWTDKEEIGGRQIDQAILKLVVARLGKGKLSEDEKIQYLAQIREAKESCTWEDDADFSIQLPGVGLISIQVGEVKAVIEPVIEKILVKPVNHLLTEARETPVEQIIMAGGNSLLPLLRQTLDKKLADIARSNGSTPKNFKIPIIRPIKKDDYKLAVAKGAALYSGISGERIPFRSKYTISVSQDGKRDVLWKRNDRISPSSKNSQKTIVVKHNENLLLRLESQNESPIEKPFAFHFSGIPPKKDSRLIATFEIDDLGCLRGSAVLYLKPDIVSDQWILRYELYDTDPVRILD